MRILAAITDAGVARRILECLALPTRAPPATPAPEPMFSSALNLYEPALDPFDFDQSLPEAWDVGA